jgi:hypothetical protein
LKKLESFGAFFPKDSASGQDSFRAFFFPKPIEWERDLLLSPHLFTHAPYIFVKISLFAT